MCVEDGVGLVLLPFVQRERGVERSVPVCALVVQACPCRVHREEAAARARICVLEVIGNVEGVADDVAGVILKHGQRVVVGAVVQLSCSRALQVLPHFGDVEKIDPAGFERDMFEAEREAGLGGIGGVRPRSQRRGDVVENERRVGVGHGESVGLLLRSMASSLGDQAVCSSGGDVRRRMKMVLRRI